VGGVGKTQLALRLGAELHSRYDHGVAFIALAALGDPRLLASTLAHALGLSQSSAAPPQELLHQYLADKHLLLVLDNCEHLSSAAALIGELLAQAPQLSVLATSRSPLHLKGERLVVLAPLALPPGPVPGKPLELASLGRVSSVALFVQRAHAVDALFQLSADNAQAIAAICTRLDGLPLAIELAAARTRLFTPGQLLARLERRFALLSQGRQDSPERHRSLSAVLDWSHQLLSPQAQALFAALSVFRGGATLAAIQAVCSPEDSEPKDSEPKDSAVEDLVDTLLDHSLVQRVHGGEEDGHRFAMLETVQAYAQQRLEQSGRAHETHQRHANYFTVWAEGIEPQLRGPQQTIGFDQFTRAQADLRAAMRWGIDCEPELAFRLCAAQSEFWSVRGHSQEGRSTLESVLALAGSPPLALRSKCLFALARLALLLGDLPCAEASLENAAGLSRQADDLMGVARALNGLGLVAMGKGCYQEVVQYLEESRDLAAQAQQRRFVSMVAANLGMAKCNLGDYASGRQLLAESLAFQRQFGDDNTVCHCLVTLGDLAHIMGDYAEAKACQDEVLELGKKVGNRRHVNAALLAQGELAADLCDFEASIRWLDEGLAQSRLVGDQYMVAFLLSCRGKVALSQGQLALAGSLLQESHALFRESSADNGLNDCLSRMVRCCVLQGDLVQARHFLGELIGLRDKVFGHARAALIETAAYFSVSVGDMAFAAMLLGAAAAVRARGGTPMCPADSADQERLETETRAKLGARRSVSLQSEGGRASLDAVFDELSARYGARADEGASMPPEPQQSVALST
jgi:predicted ATPase